MTDYENMSAGVMKFLKPSDEIIDLSGIYSSESNALRYIPAEDSEIFKARLFKAEIKASLASGATKYLTFITPPATKEDPVFVLWVLI